MKLKISLKWISRLTWVADVPIIEYIENIFDFLINSLLYNDEFYLAFERTIIDNWWSPIFVWFAFIPWILRAALKPNLKIMPQKYVIPKTYHRHYKQNNIDNNKYNKQIDEILASYK